MLIPFAIFIVSKCFLFANCFLFLFICYEAFLTSYNSIEPTYLSHLLDSHLVYVR